MNAGYYNDPALHANQENTVQARINVNNSVLFIVIVLVATPAWAEEGPKPISFVRDVAPILVAQCQACHGSETAESNYRLDTFMLMMQPGDFGTAPITAGDPDDSEICRRITAPDPEERMPNNGDRLADVEIQIIEDWIRQGAKFDGQDARAPLREQLPHDIPHRSAPERYPAALPVTALVFSANGEQLIAGGYHELFVWDATTGKLIRRVGNIPQRTFGLAFSPNGSWLAVAGGSPGVAGEVRILAWDQASETDVSPKVLARHDDVFFDVAFRPDGQRLAACATDGSVRIFDVATGAEQMKISSHADWVNDVCYSADGNYIATASRDKTAKVFDAETGRLLTTHSEHNAPVRAVAFAPDGTSVVSAAGSQIRIWNREDSKLFGEIGGIEGDVHDIAMVAETILAGSADGRARQFRFADRTLIRSLEQRPSPIVSIAAHASTELLATGCLDGVVTIRDLRDGHQRKQFLAVPHTAPTSKH